MIPEMTSHSLWGIRRLCGGEGGEMDVSEHRWSTCCLRNADVDDGASIGGARDGGMAALLQTSRRNPCLLDHSQSPSSVWRAISSLGLLASFQSSSSTLVRNLSRVLTDRPRNTSVSRGRLSLCASRCQNFDSGCMLHFLY